MAHAHEQLEGDTAHVLELLRRPDAAPVGDKSSPEELLRRFGLSKKAFKRAVGRLLKEQLVQITPQGYVKPR